MVEDPVAELRALWREQWLGCLQDLADLEMQRATWLNPHNLSPHYSYVEFTTSYFDDMRLRERDGGYAARIRNGLLSDAEAAAVAEFHQLLRFYTPPDGDAYAHQAILGDPHWLAVVTAAQAARKRLLALLTSPAEIRALTERPVYAYQAAERGPSGRA